MKLSNCNISSCSCYHAMDVSSRYMSFKGRGHNKRVLDHHHHHHHLYSLSINTHTSLGKLYTGSYRILSRTARWNYCWWRSYSSTWSLWRWATIAWVFIIRISLANHLKIHLPATKPEQLHKLFGTVRVRRASQFLSVSTADSTTKVPISWVSMVLEDDWRCATDTSLIAVTSQLRRQVQNFNHFVAVAIGFFATRIGHLQLNVILLPTQ